MQDHKSKESLESELETLKEMLVDMGRYLEMLQFVRKDLETIASNLETLEALNKDWCRHVERERMKKNDAQKDTNL